MHGLLLALPEARPACPEKAKLLKQFGNGKLDGITPEELHTEIEGYKEVINEYKKTHVNAHDAAQETQSTYIVKF